MTDYEFFLTREQYVNNYSFLNFAFDRIERDFMEYFEYVPLEENHLNVSSMRLADLILRVFPLLGIAFRTVTFGIPMKTYLDRLENQKKPLLEKVVEKVSKLHAKQSKNKDTIWDYYRLLNHETTNGFIGTGKLSDTVLNLRARAGRIHMAKHIQPFLGSNWEDITENRNAVEHRGKITATLEESINTLACLAILLESNAKLQDNYPLDFGSEIFLIDSFFPYGRNVSIF